MKASLIVPCWNCARTLPRFLASVRAQTFPDFETIFVDDGSTDDTANLLEKAVAEQPQFRLISQANAGVSAARNAGLDAATGEFVFFADPDDVLRPTMLAKGVAALEADAADYCVFPHDACLEGTGSRTFVPLKGPCRYASNDEIVAQHLSRMFGYSFDHVRAWYAGTPLFAHRVHGGVWSCAFRRSVIEANHLRFDTRIVLYEDAMFNCAYLLHAQRMTCVDEPLYDYHLAPTGAMTRLRRSGRELANKLELLRARKELDAAAGGRLGPYYAASCVFSVFEMLKIVFTGRAPFRVGLRQVRAYACDPVVRQAVSAFPLSFRHPLLAAGVLALRLVLPRPA